MTVRGTVRADTTIQDCISFYRLCVSFMRLSEYVIGVLCNGDEVY